MQLNKNIKLTSIININKQLLDMLCHGKQMISNTCQQSYEGNLSFIKLWRHLYICTAGIIATIAICSGIVNNCNMQRNCYNKFI